MQANIQYKGLQLEIFCENIKQRSNRYIYPKNSFNPPGKILENQPVMALHRWPECNGDCALQQYTTGVNDITKDAIAQFVASDGIIKDASFARLKNIELSWQLPSQWFKNITMKHCRLYAQAQNLFTITRYKGFDPETRNIFTLPPLRTLAVGIELSF